MSLTCQFCSSLQLIAYYQSTNSMSEEGTRSCSGQRKHYKDTLNANLKCCDIAPPELEELVLDRLCVEDRAICTSSHSLPTWAYSDPRSIMSMAQSTKTNSSSDSSSGSSSAGFGSSISTLLSLSARLKKNNHEHRAHIMIQYDNE